MRVKSLSAVGAHCRKNGIQPDSFVFNFLRPRRSCGYRTAIAMSTNMPSAKARAGVLKEFTGISDPYEAPLKAELNINTAGHILELLRRQGYIKTAQDI